MTDSTKNALKNILNLVAFAFFLGLVIFGQKTVGYTYLFIQLIGLAGLLCQLWVYNRKFR